jgi:hypothetical protein
MRVPNLLEREVGTVEVFLEKGQAAGVGDVGGRVDELARGVEGGESEKRRGGNGVDVRLGVGSDGTLGVALGGMRGLDAFWDVEDRGQGRGGRGCSAVGDEGNDGLVLGGCADGGIEQRGIVD